jgi:thiol-disulfide isomerase/thioredoxin
LRLKERDPALGATVRVIGVVAAFAIGGYLGWNLFLDPTKDGATETTVAADFQSDPTSPPYSIQPTGTQVSSLSESVRVGWPAPDFTLSSLSDQSHSLAEHLGTAVILNFWTTWCPPCRLEMPALQQLFESYREKGLVILGINLTEIDDLELVEPYRQELGLTFPILLDVESVVSEGPYNILGLPTSVFIDRQGIVREVYIGALPLPELESKVQSIMADKQ